MKKIIILSLLLIVVTTLFSITRLDQLKLELEASSGLNRILILDELQRSYWKIYPAASLEFGVEALRLSTTLNNTIQQAKQLQNIAESYRHMDNYERAIEFMLMSLNKARKADNAELQIAAYYYLATYNNHIHKNVIAFEYAVLAIELSEEHDNHPGLAKCYFIIAEIYYALGDTEGAYKYYELSLSQHKNFTNRSSFAFTNEKLGQIDLFNKNYQYAEKHFKIAADNYAQIDNLESLVRTYEALGKIYKETGKKQKALDYIEKFAETNEKLNQEIKQNNFLINYEYYNIQGNEEKALEYYKLYAAQQDSLQTVFTQKQVETRISEIETKEYEKTTEKIFEVTQKAVEEIKEKEKAIEKLQTEKDIQEENIKLENEKKRKQIEELQKDREEKEKKLAEQKKQQRLYYAYIIISIFIVILLLALSIVLLRHSRMRKKHALEMEKIAKTDPLTLLPNRRATIEKINYEIVRYRRNNKQFTIVISDIDNFKAVNDNHGHDAGDKVLVTLAKLMTHTIRKQDICARWGGEEFLFLLPETDAAGGVTISEKIRKQIDKKIFKFNDNVLPVTMTFGLCTFSKDLTIDECISNADKALYEGKKTGKNRVVQYNDLSK